MNKIVVLTGPTAVGKSNLSIELAKKINGEIISADSMQVYKNMDIGSAKITKTEMQGVKHYLIDVLEPEEDFNVYIFSKMAKDAINTILKNNKTPIIVGGTGFYIQAILYDIDFKEEDNSLIREKYEKIAEEKGNIFLHDMLKTIDEESYNKIHPNNVKRVIRAIEYYEINNKPISSHNKEQKMKKTKYDVKYFVLNDERERLYEKIDSRVDEMFEKGLVDEVKILKERGLDKDNNSMQGIGYKEIIDYLNGDISLEEAKYIIKRDTRHFAKRQLTWFRREENIKWINKKDYNYDDERILSKMIEIIEND